MKKITLLAFFSVFTTLVYGQIPDPPEADMDQAFCSTTAWALIGESADNLGDLQIFPDQPGWTLKWYSDAALTTQVANPNTEILVGGTTYYVTQTNTANQESLALPVTVTERDCACIKDPTFEDQQGNPRARGYQAYQQGIPDHKTCGQDITGATLLSFPGAAPLPFPTNVVGNPNDAVFVTPGPDPTANIPLQRTNPENPASSHGFRINRNGVGPAKVTTLTKSFVAGEVFVFNFAVVLNNPAGHDFEQQPFAQARIYDEFDNLILTRCLVSEPSDCIFNIVNPGSSQSLYSTWSCIKFNTFDIQGRPARLEVTAADCTLSGHYGYMYIDDIYVGNDSDDICGNSSFGYALIEEVKSAGASDCFVLEPAEELQGCVPGLSGSIPGFPLEVCGIFTSPVSTGGASSITLSDVTLNIIQNDNIVGTLTNPAQGTGGLNSFCFTVNDTDINVLPYGNFVFDVQLNYELDCGDPYDYVIDDSVSFDLCPTAGCPTALAVCDIAGNGFSIFDLTDANNEIYGNWNPTDVTITYYESADDAFDGVNAISNFQNYQNTTPNNQTVYAHLDWNVAGLVSDCFYLVEIELLVNVIPDLLADRDIVICGTNVQTTLIGTPNNLADLGTVTYTWFKNGNQIPHIGSSYDITQSGVYTVVVSHMDCDVSRTFTVSNIAFDVDLGNDVEICDGTTSHVINGNVVIDPNSDPIDPNDFTYLWSTGETTQNITVTTTGLYWLEVTVGDCTVRDEVQVSFRNFDLDLGEDVSICDVNEGYNLFAELTGADLNEVSYLWSTGETTPNITVNNYGTYTVDVTWGTCVQTDQIVISQTIPAEISLGNTILKCENDVVTLNVQFIDPNTGNLIYTWYRDGGMLPDNTQSISVTDFGVFRVEVDNDGCVSVAEVLVEGYPSNPNCVITQGISPDGSPGFNDNLNLEFLAMRTGIENIQIFNRNGTLVYERQNYVNEWVGQTLDGDSLPTGLYFYVINFNGEDAEYGTQKTGNIYINRGMN